MMELDRRSLLGGLAAGSAAITAAASARAAGRMSERHGSMIAYAAPKLRTVRAGIIGTGARGQPMVELLTNIDGVRINAMCDIDAAALDKTMAIVAGKQRRAPSRITGANTAFQRLVDRDDIDAVFIFTPWEWHAPMALAAMQAGKHAFVEVPMVMTQEDCWKLVDASEATRRHCMMMENCCYGREEMMVLNMVRQQAFGELLHGAGAYIHELRDQIREPDTSEGKWRPQWHARQHGNLYPTHGLGPVAQYMDINRGDRFDYLVSMDSPAIGMGAYARRELPAGHPRTRLNYIAGDINSSLVKTVRGRTILVQHDTTTPRPYDRLNYLQGTNGAFGGYPARIALEKGGGETYHEWDGDMDKWFARYEHPLWARIRREATERGGHGGMDFVMLWRIIHCLRNGLPVDQPVYDGAAWSVLTELTDRSVRSRSAPQDVPDFTRGAWERAPRLEITA